MSPTLRHLTLQRTVKLFDLGAVGLTFLAAFAIASGSFTWHSLAEVLAMRIEVFNLLFIAGYVAFCAATFNRCGFYLSHRLSQWRRELREIFTAVTLITGILWLLRWPFDFSFANDRFLFVFWLLTFTVLMLSRVAGHYLLYYARSHGRNLRRLVIVGEGFEATDLAERIERESTLGYRVVRVINTEEN